MLQDFNCPTFTILSVRNGISAAHLEGLPLEAGEGGVVGVDVDEGVDELEGGDSLGIWILRLKLGRKLRLGLRTHLGMSFLAVG